MENSKVNELVGSFNMHEVKAFRSYLSSAYFNADKNLQKSFDCIIKFNADEKTWNRKNLHEKIFPEKKFSDQQIRYLLTDLCKHIEYFLTIRTLDSNKVLYRSIASKTLSGRDCEKAYNFVYDSINAENKNKNALFYYHLYDSAENHLGYSSKKQSRKIKFDYSGILINLEIFYLAKKLQLFCEVINLKNILTGEYELHLMDEIKKLSVKEPFSEIPVVQIYYYILLTLTEPEKEKHLEYLEKLLIENAALFPASELMDMYQYVKNYCVKKINQGNTEYIRRLFEIYKIMLANKPLMNHDYLSQFEFKNMVSISLRLKENAWCKTFISKYINYLKPEERKNAFTYNSAYLNFMSGDFKNSIRKLREVEFTDVVYQVDSRVIFLKCYYELDDIETFFYHASAFRLFLLRNRNISEFQKTINRNLIKFLTKIVRAYTSKTKLAQVKKEISREKNVADLKWLEEKVDMLL
ncbi:MAG: hypothetical protein ABI855_19330 [Bacteroidota bacterium]